MTINRVLIIGGGCAGPALALALARRGIKSSIFEIRPEGQTSSGSSISLAPNAMRCLDAVIGVGDRLRAKGFSYKRLEMRADDGTLFGHVLQSDEKSDALRIMRATLHQEMIDACRSQPDLISVRFNARLDRIEEMEDGVKAQFEDDHVAEGSILIGADGIHSKVREHVLDNEAPKASFAGTAIISGSLPLSSVKAPDDFSFPCALITAVGLVAVFPHSHDGKEVAWFIGQDAKDRSRAEWQEYEKSGQALEAARAHYADSKSEYIRSLLDNATAEGIRLWVPYEIPLLPRWTKGRVALMGDAAHGFPPNGQGAACAFEDAAYLALLIADNADATYDRIFAQYERNRRPRVEAVQKLGHAATPTKTGASLWLYALKKQMIRGFFWFKGYELKDTRISAYDITTQSTSIE